MGAALEITRTDQTAPELRSIAGKCHDAAQVRRLLAIGSVLAGRSRSEAAAQSGMDRQTLRDWVVRYNEGGVDGLKSRRSPGPVAALTGEQMAELRALVIKGPDPATHNPRRHCRHPHRDLVSGRGQSRAERHARLYWGAGRPTSADGARQSP